MRKTLVSVAVIFMCIFMFTGCYSGNTLEERVSDRQLRKMEEQLMENSEIRQSFNDVKIEVSGNHITYKFYFSMYMDETQVIQAKSYLLNSNYDSQIANYKEQFEKAFKIHPSLVTFEFYTPDGISLGKVEG